LGAASKDRSKQGFRVLIVACILGRALAPLYYGRRILAGQYGVYRRILLFVYVLVVRFTLLWRPQGELARIPRHITLEAPANHRPSGNCTDPAEPAPHFLTAILYAGNLRRADGKAILFIGLGIMIRGSGIVRFFRGVVVLALRGLCFHAKVHGPRQLRDLAINLCLHGVRR
jgi:hypothetical protein